MQPALGTTEIAILRYLGEHPRRTVAEVAESFARTSGQARTTILTIMERLRKKGYLKREAEAGIYRYSLHAARQDWLRGLIQSFVETTLGGSVAPFVAYLSESGPVSDQDLKELKKLVRDLEAQRQEDRP